MFLITFKTDNPTIFLNTLSCIIQARGQGSGLGAYAQERNFVSKSGTIVFNSFFLQKVLVTDTTTLKNGSENSVVW